MEKLKKGNPCFIVAEIGINHDGSLEKALALIAEAKKCGCDAVKFQCFVPETLAKERKKPELTQFLKKYYLSPEQLDTCFKAARQSGIIPFSSCFCVESAKTIISLGAALIKIPAPSSSNKALIDFVMESPTQKVISYYGNHVPYPNAIICYTTPYYPTKLSDLHLKNLANYDGYSDHTGDSSIVPAAAAAFGACYYEAHFQLRPNPENPDSPCSLLPEGMKNVVKLIRQVESIL